MTISKSSDRSDVVESSIIHGLLTVGTTAVEVKVGGSRVETRQIVVIYNESKNRNMYWGGAGVTNSGSTRGIPILPEQTVSLPAGDLAIYIVGQEAAMTAIISEIG